MTRSVSEAAKERYLEEEAQMYAEGRAQIAYYDSVERAYAWSLSRIRGGAPLPSVVVELRNRYRLAWRRLCQAGFSQGMLESASSAASKK